MTISLIDLDKHTTTALPYNAARPSSASGALWLDVSAPTEDDLGWLAHTYVFHPLTIEDCREFNQRAKIEAYASYADTTAIAPSPAGSDSGAPRSNAGPGYLFLTFMLTARADGDLRAQEMEAFLGPDYLITVHREPIPVLDAVREQCTKETRSDFVLYRIADKIVDAYFPLLDEMDDEIDALEDQILENATQATMERIFTLKQQLVLLRKITAPMREVMNALAGTRFGLIDTQTALYFRDVYDHLTRIYDLIETSRDLLGNSLDAYLSIVSNRLNEVMKRLTLFTTVFMPISFLVGFGGMNFVQMPFNNPVVFSLLMALLIFVPLTMVIWFRRSKWV
jgi:magnesium transporter